MWFKVDDSFYDHPKIASLSMAARGLWVTCGSYCGRHLTDGHVTRKTVRLLAGRSAAQVRELVSAGLWVECGEHSDCVRFHDWADTQPTREAEIQRRKDAAERKRRSRTSNSRVSDESSTGNSRVSDESSTGNSRVSDESSKSSRTNTRNGDNQDKQENVTGDVTRDVTQDVTQDVPRDPHAGGRATRVDPTRPDLKEDNSSRAAASPDVTREPETRRAELAARVAAAADPHTFGDGTPVPPAPHEPDPPPPPTRGALALVHDVDHTPAAIDANPPPRRVHVGDAARTLVRATIPAGIPKAICDQLAEQVQRLAADRRVNRADIEAGLTAWASRPGAGPRLLPNLVADAARTAAPRESTTDRKLRETAKLYRPEWDTEDENPYTPPQLEQP